MGDMQEQGHYCMPALQSHLHPSKLLVIYWDTWYAATRVQ